MAASAIAAPPARAPGSPRLALLLAVIGLIAAGLAAYARLTFDPIGRPSTAVTVLHVAAGVAFLVVGALAALVRRRNRVGLLMTAVGLTWFIIDLQFTTSSVAFTIGNLLGILTWAVLAHLVLAFPGGLLVGSLDRAVVAAGYVWTVLGNVLTELVYAPPGGGAGPPQMLLVLHRDASGNHVANQVQLAANIALGVVVLSLLVAHWWSASRLGRRALEPALWSSAPIFGVVLALNAVGLVASPEWLNAALPALTPLALMTLPLAFLAGMIRSRLSRLAVGPLVVELREAPTPHHLRDVVARALADPSVAIAYRLPGAAQWVDASGAAVDLPPASDVTRSHTILERGGEAVAALIHDRAVDDDPALIASVAAAASLALENERLQAEVRAQLAEVRASRARIVEAADAERRNLQRDIHDGAQQRLVALALRLGRLRDRALTESDATTTQELTEACDQLREAIAELREMSSGIHPAILVEAGLGPALQSLADVALVPVRVTTALDGRLPDRVESAAYFVVSECLANVAKHAGAHAVAVGATRHGDRLVISVEDDGRGGADSTRGSGLSGLRDRVTALEGRLVIESVPGHGTRVVAELPCA